LRNTTTTSHFLSRPLAQSNLAQQAAHRHSRSSPVRQFASSPSRHLAISPSRHLAASLLLRVFAPSLQQQYARLPVLPVRSPSCPRPSFCAYEGSRDFDLACALRANVSLRNASQFTRTSACLRGLPLFQASAFPLPALAACKSPTAAGYVCLSPAPLHQFF
jgi:hypothetical protein